MVRDLFAAGCYSAGCYAAGQDGARQVQTDLGSQLRRQVGKSEIGTGNGMVF